VAAFLSPFFQYLRVDLSHIFFIIIVDRPENSAYSLYPLVLLEREAVVLLISQCCM